MGEWINKNKKIILTIFLMLIIIISGTVAWLTWKSKESSLVLTVGEVNGPTISLYPYQFNGTLSPVLSYESMNYVQVEATNNRSKKVKAKLFYNIKSIDSALISSDVKYTVTSSDSKNGTYTEYATGDFSSALAGNVLEIANISIPANSNKFYRVYVWLDGNGSNSTAMQGKTLSIELRAEFMADDIIPVLDSGMIPVTISDTGVVTTISKSDSNWYNYDEKKWANVVLTTSSSRSNYLGTSGVTVSESDILAYLVWIPRYKYKIWTTTTSSKGGEQAIDIIFENTDTPKSTGTTVDSYLTHPAFTFDDMELNGMWVGKFETTGNATTPTVKPNLQSLKSQNVSTQFATAQKFGTSTYGSTSKIDAHMMKNSEWGAVTYLLHSKYGVNREVYINNSSGYYTGRSGGNVGGSTAINTVYTNQTSTTQYNTYGFYTWDGYLLNYNTNTKSSTHNISKVASTTGNITGVYDMSGGSWEYVMGNYNNTISSSGFSTLPNSEYYDNYTTTNTLTACNGGICYGHALSETASWYSDYADFVNSNGPWFMRGGRYINGAYAGAFGSSGYDGNAFDDTSFRLVIVPLSYQEPAEPELDDGMIPVTISDIGVVTTIDKNNSNWYNYENKKWANVVLTTSSSRSKYLNTTGVSVSESDILAYLVWIPRYKYKIWTTTISSTGIEQTIEVVFEDKTTPKSTGTTVDSYRTHPAFTFGDTELNGIWVGKFETTGNSTTPTVKPNLQSLRSQRVSVQFLTAQKFGTSTYGSTSKIDAHMMKNSEWGAVAYLSHSNYGVNREIYINNSSSYYTGRSGGNVGGSTAINTVYTNQTSTTQYNTYGFYTWDGYLLDYNTNTKSSTHNISKVASTTGNITGVYDMSGGAWEYVMGNYNNTISSSGFSTLPNSKYYDTYSITSNDSCTIATCGGHALFETNKWYSDYAYFVNSSNPWFLRGGSYSNGANAGAFYSFNIDGNVFSSRSFRLVLSAV